MTYSQIKALFDKYNTLYFNDELTCKIELNPTGRVTRRYGDFSRMRNRIRIFSKMHRNSSEAMWKGTIIHEMTHAILAKRGDRNGCGHTPQFHAILGPIMTMEFGIPYTRNRFVQTALEKVTNIKVETHPDIDADRFKVVSTGKVGTLVKESTIYGKKHVTLKIEGLLFPFTTQLDNVERIAA
jgi:predicted SprT family Zn-dependent metalloprotease